MKHTFLQVALGGALGSMARYGVNILAGRVTGLPLGTLTVNIAGCFAMGLLASVLALRGGQHLAPLLLTGVLGGFTTFSAFSLDTLTLWSDEMLRLDTETLTKVLKLGAKIKKLIGRAPAEA